MQESQKQNTRPAVDYHSAPPTEQSDDGWQMFTLAIAAILGAVFALYWVWSEAMRIRPP